MNHDLKGDAVGLLTQSTVFQKNKFKTSNSLQ